MKYYIEAESDQEIGDWFVPKTEDWEADVDWADVIVFDDIWVGNDVGTGALAQELREQGKANTVDHRIFHEFDAAIQFVQENPAPYVIKPLGEVQNVKRLLYVGECWIDGDGDRLQAWGYFGPKA